MATPIVAPLTGTVTTTSFVAQDYAVPGVSLPSGKPFHYEIMMPSQYSTNFLWPLMIWLHPVNSGNAWYNGSASTISVNDAAPQYQNVTYQRTYPSICIVPYADETTDNSGGAIENWGGWINTGGTGNGTTFNGETGPNTFALNGLVQHLITTLSIDPARVYVNGFSLGGIGAEYFMLRYNQVNGNPKLYTAGTSTGGVLEIHGGGAGPNSADVTTMRNVPVWWVSGQNDGTSVPTHWNTLMWQQLAGNSSYPAQGASEAASRAGSTQYHFSYCAGVGHSPVNGSGVYMQSTPTILNWLFAQGGTVSTGTGKFLVANGKIIKPDGTVFVGAGINIRSGEFNQAVSNAACQPLTTLFPGINIVRVAYEGGQSPYSTSEVIAIANRLTAIGIVAVIEDHTSISKPPYTGTILNNESAWYASLATTFLNNPYVWFGTVNEPGVGDGSDLAGIASQQVSTYNAVRGTGNNTIVLLEEPSGGNVGLVGQMPASSYSGMRNVVWDLHMYGYIVQRVTGSFSTNLSTIETVIRGSVSGAYGIAACQIIRSADGVVPVIIGECGDSTDGSSIDSNGSQNCAAIGAIVGEGSAVGFMFWDWVSPGLAGDKLTDGNSNLTTYGNQIAGLIAAAGTTSGPPVFTVSPNNTVILPGNPALITDTVGITYGIVGGQVSINGTTDTTTSNVVILAFVNSVVWQKNSAGNWYSRSGGTWVGPTTVSPLPTVSASGSFIVAPTSSVLTDASFNGWGISSGVVSENGATITTPGGTIVVTRTNGLSVTDGSGHIWTLTSAGVAMEDGGIANGGSGTGALTVFNGTLYAQDGSGSTGAAGSSTTAANGESMAISTVGNQVANASFTVTGTISGITGTLPAPAIAASAGYNTLTYGPALVLNKTVSDPITSYPIFGGATGANIVPYTFSGTSWTNIGLVQNADGSISQDGTGQAFGNGMTTAAAGGNNTLNPLQFTGIAFGGGAYFQARMKSAGPMSFWANDIETVNGTSIGKMVNGTYVNGTAYQWPGQAAGYGNWIETDFAEFDDPLSYGIAVHNWYGIVGSGLQKNTNFSKVAFAPGQTPDFTQYHDYGALWVPATATVKGRIDYYFDGTKVSTTTWNQYNPALGPPPNDPTSYNPNTIFPTVQTGGGNSAYSVLDQLHLAVIFGGAPGYINTIASLQVWQASTANNISTLAAVSSGVAPTLQYQDNAGTWQALPSGATVTATSFSFVHPGMASTSSATIAVRDANNTAAGSVSNVFGVGVSGGAWYTWNGTGFVAAGTTPPTNTGPAVVELAYVNTLIWEKDAVNNWYSTTTATPITWVGPTTTSPLTTVPGGLSYILPMKQAGIRVITYIKQESPASFPTGLASLRAEQSSNHDVFAYEGCQEPDTAVLTGTPETLASAASFQQTVKTAGQADGLAVIQTSFGVASNYGTTGNLAAFATYGNAHTYTGTLNSAPNDGPSPGFIATMTANALLTSPGLPTVHSEWGWKADHNSPTAIASYVLDFIMSAYFDGNLPYYIVNGLYDDTTGQWGMFNNDQSPRLVATALQNFFTLLKDNAGNALSFGPGKLNIAISNLPTGANANMGGKFGVLQKADGSFFVLVRNEQSLTTSDANNHTPITVAPISCTVTLGTLATTIAVYDPLIGTTPVQTGSNTSSITFSLPAHPVLIKIVRP